MGAFENYVRAYGGHPPGNNPRDGYFADWLTKIDKSALYYVTSKEQRSGQLQLVATLPYRNMQLHEQMVYVYKRPS